MRRSLCPISGQTGGTPVRAGGDSIHPWRAYYSKKAAEDRTAAVALVLWITSIAFSSDRHFRGPGSAGSVRRWRIPPPRLRSRRQVAHIRAQNAAGEG